MKRVGTEPFCAHDSLVLISGSALDQFIPCSIELCVPVSLKKNDILTMWKTRDDKNWDDAYLDTQSFTHLLLLIL